MPRIIARPPELDLDSPGRRDYWVALEHDSLWADHLIPLTVFVGPDVKEGEGLVASGSNHGNEYEGPVAIKHLLREFNVKDVTGRVILIPVLNPSAFQAGHRSSVNDDGVNLNRAFVDGAGVTPALAGITHRIAAFYRQYIWRRVHVVIDIHSGGEVAQIVQTSSFHPLNDPDQHRRVEDAARWFGTPFVMTYQDETPGLLPSEAERLGKITVGTELGYGESVNPTGVRYAKHGILAAAIHERQMRGTIRKIDHHAAGTQKMLAIVDRRCFVPAPFPGHYEPLLSPGTEVTEGQTVGYLHDFHRIDEPAYEINAGLDGVLVCQAWRAPIPQGAHIVVVGSVIG